MTSKLNYNEFRAQYAEQKKENNETYDKHELSRLWEEYKESCGVDPKVKVVYEVLRSVTSEKNSKDLAVMNTPYLVERLVEAHNETHFRWAVRV